ncbi:hypothetical protein [Candidatus Erwinia haradaeae]|nr:hypothetical protein [Candidatus Erwinia haradaeae]
MSYSLGIERAPICLCQRGIYNQLHYTIMVIDIIFYGKKDIRTY